MIIYPHDPRYTFTVRDDQPTDAVVIREIWCENVYEVFDGDLSDTKMVVDVGANIGAFSIYMHSLNPDALVLAVEPQATNLEVLKENIRLNHLEDHIVIDQHGLSDKPGTGYITDEGGGSRLATQGQKIDLITLEQLWHNHNLEYIDVLKVDIEGAECMVLLAARKQIIEWCRFIVVEFDNHAEDGLFGQLVAKLSETHQLKIVGSAKQGGYIYAHRY